MSKSYTPGLKVLKNTTLIKERLLPLKGEVHVDEEDVVESNTIVASTAIPGNVQMVNVAKELNIDANQILDCMLVKENDYVTKGQIIAQNKDRFIVLSLVAKSNIKLLTKQAVLLRPKYVVIEEETCYKELKSNLVKYQEIEVLCGKQSIIDIAKIKCDLFINLTTRGSTTIFGCIATFTTTFTCTTTF